MKTTLARLLGGFAVGLVATCLGSLAQLQTTSGILTAADVTISGIGDTGTSEISIQGTLPDGLSGGRISLQLPAGVGQITAVSFNGAFELTNEGDLTLPATSVELQFADLTGDFPAGSSDIPIASVTIEALGAGSGVIALGVVTPPGVDDFYGDDISLDIDNGILTVVAETAAVFRVDSQGNVFADRAYYGADFLAGGADIAEYINVREPVDPGDVVELDPEQPGYYRKSCTPYSTLVAGVISTTPGITMGAQAGAEQEKILTPPLLAFGLNLGNLSISRIAAFPPQTSLMLSLGLALLGISEPIDLSFDFTLKGLQLRMEEAQRPMLALMGVVTVKATTENGRIKPGDLLTTSTIPGYAMRCDDPEECAGAIIGKALEPLDEGAGLIQMLVMR